MRFFIVLLMVLVSFHFQAQQIAAVGQTTKMETALFKLQTERHNVPLSQSNALSDDDLALADTAFYNEQYAEAVEHYETALAVAKNVLALQTLQKGADSYYAMGDMRNAQKWYGNLYKNYGPALGGEDLSKYATALRVMGKEQNANAIMKLVTERDLSGNSFAPPFIYHQGEASLHNLNINTEYSEFGTIFKPDGRIVFASSGQAIGSKNNGKNWNNQPYLDLFEASAAATGFEFTDITTFPKAINSKQHEASATFSPDGKTMYFTRNNDQRNTKKKKNINHLKIYMSQLNGDKWSSPKEVPFNDEDYSTGHPALSPDGKQMYFVSDMPGGYGYTDLYVVDVYKRGRFSKPKNLGPEINSKKKEMFPYVTANNIYFSSNRASGMGGLDIYQSTISANGNVSEPVNMGVPYNSIRDDFSFIMKNDGKTGYLASNRKGGKGNDDIYYFMKEALKDVPVNENSVTGVLVDADSQQPIGNAAITLFDAEALKVAETTSKPDGTFYLKNLISKHKYTLNVQKERYEDLKEVVATKDNIPLQLTQKLIPLERAEVAEVVHREPIETIPVTRLQETVSSVVSIEEVPTEIAEVEQKEIPSVSFSEPKESLEERAEETVAEVLEEHYEEVVEEPVQRIEEKIEEIEEIDGVEEIEEVVEVVETVAPKRPKRTQIAVVNNKNDLPVFKTEAQYFDFDSFDVRPDAMDELDRLADYLVENSSVRLKIESHTDSRGNADYNKYLSGKRANASKEYLLSRGVAPEQIISAVGYGEEELLNDCYDGNPCSRAAHQMNRRSEFILVYDDAA